MSLETLIHNLVNHPCLRTLYVVYQNMSKFLWVLYFWHLGWIICYFVVVFYTSWTFACIWFILPPYPANILITLFSITRTHCRLPIVDPIQVVMLYHTILIIHPRNLNPSKKITFLHYLSIYDVILSNLPRLNFGLNNWTSFDEKLKTFIDIMPNKKYQQNQTFVLLHTY